MTQAIHSFTHRQYQEHPEDVLSTWISWRAAMPVALVIIVRTTGGAVRRPGALMAVAADGRAAGYISGGCIDADVILQAQRCLAEGKPARLTYGAGSPFLDLPLPCGGAIEVCILPEPDESLFANCHARLLARKPAMLSLTETGRDFIYHPKLRLRIAGRGADPLALARLARASGIETTLYLPGGPDMRIAENDGHENLIALGSASELPPVRDDAWSAFVMMFHDADREDGLLEDALAGDAFFVGAVGSARTHAARCDRLRQRGISEASIQRIHGPVGLVPSMRDASMLAVSVLSQVVAEYHKRHSSLFTRTALVLLAAGKSSRFARGDKLLSDFQGRKLIDHAATSLPDDTAAARIAIVPAPSGDRGARLAEAGWTVTPNPDAATGLASSLRCGVRAITASPDIDHVMILLADMPAIPTAHLRRLQMAVLSGHPAAMTLSGGRLSPPAIFSRSAFESLTALQGDSGGRELFQSLQDGASISLDPAYAFDIDTVTDLQLAEESAHV
ncbi:xanthine dehydrogenase [Hyphomonas sp. CACIAM 19H1]|uniref:NTP transferase domain-containing protein n=1 Tax=Hyphomonas sp. CACIAM 19H1 TaxID=1873716 RepID=UPI000DED53AE|nr:NTP transferase domain-containing protein [Hyphomonas sp. CACIAM 19H1]AXE64962.1 xanthine dehydrogenase [Hyphomonas sp. CACIAM 19H1]